MVQHLTNGHLSPLPIAAFIQFIQAVADFMISFVVKRDFIFINSQLYHYASKDKLFNFRKQQHGPFENFLFN